MNWHSDTGSNTIEDAGAWERAHNDRYDDTDRPSAGELAEMAADDAFLARRQAERDAAARARGEYVPSSAMRTQAATLSMCLVQQGVLGLAVDCAREGVFSISPEDRRSAPAPDDVLDAIRKTYDKPGYDAEVALRSGVVWVRLLRTPFGDPFVQDGTATDEPPF